MRGETAHEWGTRRSGLGQLVLRRHGDLVDDEDSRSTIFEPRDRGTCSGQQMRGKTYASEPLEQTQDLRRFMSNDQNIFTHRSNPVTLLKQYRLSKENTNSPPDGRERTNRREHRTAVTEEGNWVAAMSTFEYRSQNRLTAESAWIIRGVGTLISGCRRS